MTEETLNKIKTLEEKENVKFLNLEDYRSIKKNDYLKFKCNICNEENEISVCNLLDKRRTFKICKRCNSEMKFINKLNEIYGKNPYEFLTSFTGLQNEITVKCKDCGFIFTEKRAASLLMNIGLPENTHPCKNCTKNRRYSKKDISELEEKLIEKFGECNYIFPEPEKYAGISSKTKFKIICKKCGHEMETYINNIINPKNGKHYCRVCNKKDRLLESITYKERCLRTTNGKIEPIDEYIDSKTPIRHICKVCGYGTKDPWFKIPVKNTIRNAGCPVCAGKSVVSVAENEITNFILSLDSNLKIFRNKRDILENGQELDIYIPEKKIAIEYNGLYWHSSKYKDKNYHINKTNECDKIGIRLIQIFEDEWSFKKEIVKTKLKSILGYNNQSIYARKCKIENLSAKEKNLFLNTYHIQGSDKSAIYKCLKYNNEMVAVMSICKTRGALGKRNSNNEYELSRYASKYHVIGGFTKLLKHIVDENNIKSLITYADLRWSSRNKNVYITSGFKYDHESKPNYWYFNKNKTPLKREHRYSFRKQVLEKRFPDIFNKNLTEFEIMDKTDYRRIYDCGNLVYKWEK